MGLRGTEAVRSRGACQTVGEHVEKPELVHFAQIDFGWVFQHELLHMLLANQVDAPFRSPPRAFVVVLKTGSFLVWTKTCGGGILDPAANFAIRILPSKGAMANFRYRILVVDDDEQIRRVSAAVLSHCGYEVRVAKDGFEALALMRKALPDLIISDLKMPNMSGFEFLSVVRRRFPSIAVVAITGEFVGAPEPQGLLADAFFHKGQYSPEQLFKEIQSLLEQAPLRPYFFKPDKAPVWIPRNGSYVVLTCTECLRSFSITEEEAENGSREVPCIHCGTQICFRLEPKD